MKSLSIVLIAAAVIGALVYYSELSVGIPNNKIVKITKVPRAAEDEQTGSKAMDVKHADKLANTQMANESLEPLKDSSIALNSDNFKKEVMLCFTGYECHFEVDPEQVYEEYLRKQDSNANDLLISYLRSLLRKPELREKYKNVVLRMIDEIYSPYEKPFQMAAYYNYMGELDRSLQAYLDLEAAVNAGANLTPAPALNIANTYYDLGRFNEALPYYKKAFNDYSSGNIKVYRQADMIEFIRERISWIQKNAE